MVELKRKAEEDMANNEALEEYKKKAAREMDQLQAQVDEARANADRMDKSRKKLQAEVSNGCVVCVCALCVWVCMHLWVRVCASLGEGVCIVGGVHIKETEGRLLWCFLIINHWTMVKCVITAFFKERPSHKSWLYA